MVHVSPAPAFALLGHLGSVRHFTANKTPHIKKMIFTAALLFYSMSIGAQAQSVESQALTTISTQHEEPTAQLTEAPVSTESDYLMNFAEAAPRRRGYYGGGSAPYYSGTLELGFTSADRLGRMELLGSFGTLVSPTIYLGGGLGFNGYFSHKHRDAFWMLPLFVNFRATLPTNSVVKPFLDIKPGYSISLTHSGLHGFYFALSGGIVVNRFTISLGYAYQEFNSSRYFDKHWGSSGGVSLKFGILF